MESISQNATGTGIVTDSPGPVTNLMLLERKNHQRSLKENLDRGTHYILVPELAWDLLIQWYGLSEKSTYIARLDLFVSCEINPIMKFILLRLTTLI